MHTLSAFLAGGASLHVSPGRLVTPLLCRRHSDRRGVRICAGRRHAPMLACVGSSGLGSASDEARYSDARKLRWCEILFNSLEEELSAVDEYEQLESLPVNDPWPIFLRGAAYEHWGRPRLALAQYDLVHHAKGLLRIPDLWMRKAYNAFKLGDVVVADAYHLIADGIRADAVGNQLHFSFWFEENFAQFKPRHNGPSFPLQAAICRYCADPKAMSKIRNSLAPIIFAKAGPAVDLQHAALWMLAACANMKSLEHPVTPSSLNPKDVEIGRKAFDCQTEAGGALSPLVTIFLDPSPSALAAAEQSVLEPDEEHEEHSVVRGLYLALYHDAFTKDDVARDRWLDFVADSEQPRCTHGYDDFMYFAARNRLSVPPDSDQTRPVANF